MIALATGTVDPDLDRIPLLIVDNNRITFVLKSSQKHLAKLDMGKVFEGVVVAIFDRGEADDIDMQEALLVLYPRVRRCGLVLEQQSKPL